MASLTRAGISGARWKFQSNTGGLWIDGLAKAHATRQIGALEAAVAERHGKAAFVEEHRFHLKFAAISHGKPEALVELLISKLETKMPDVGAEQSLHQHRYVLGEKRSDHNRLKLRGVHQNFAGPAGISVVVAIHQAGFPGLKTD